MKANIHPTWYEDAKVTCACGASFTVGATQPEIRVEVCANCHPFYTGEAKYIDTLGRVEKFQQRLQSVKTSKRTKAEKMEVGEETPKSLREILAEMKTKKE